MGGLLFWVGLFVVGWIMLWARPTFGFLATYAIGMLVLLFALNVLFGGFALILNELKSVPGEYLLPAIGGLLVVILGPVLIWTAIGSGIVLVRKRFGARQ